MKKKKKEGERGAEFHELQVGRQAGMKAGGVANLTLLDIILQQQSRFLFFVQGGEK